MSRKALLITAGVAALLSAATVVATWPRKLSAQDVNANYKADLANGEVMFNAGNCAGCHQSSGQEDRSKLGGGLRLSSPFGIFVTPNISPDPKSGIGAWSELEFINAMKRGVGRNNEHLYPAFPYPSYSFMRTKDVRDLFAYLKTLPADKKVTPPHELAFPYNIRYTVGFWKLLNFHPKEFAPVANRDSEWNRGFYLVEGAAHCAECHTPRDTLGGMVEDKRYVGGESLEKGGRFASNITSHADGLGDWSAEEIADFLKTGTDRCFNEPEGMRAVLASTSRLPSADTQAMGAYLRALPPLPGNGKHKSC